MEAGADVSFLSVPGSVQEKVARISDISKADGLRDGGWALADPSQTWMQQTGEGKASPLSSLEQGRPSSPPRG